eukprot:g18594.t1
MNMEMTPVTLVMRPLVQKMVGTRAVLEGVADVGDLLPPAFGGDLLPRGRSWCLSLLVGMLIIYAQGKLLLLLLRLPRASPRPSEIYRTTIQIEVRGWLEVVPRTRRLERDRRLTKDGKETSSPTTRRGKLYKEPFKMSSMKAVVKKIEMAVKMTPPRL